MMDYKCMMCGVTGDCITSQQLCLKCSIEAMITEFRVKMQERGLSEEKINKMLKSEGLIS